MTVRVHRVALAAVLCAPAVALAQTPRVTRGTNVNAPLSVGHQACIDNQATLFSYDLVVTPSIGDTVKVFITKDTASCTSTTADPTTSPSPPLVQPSQTSQTGSVSATPQQMLLDLENGCANTTASAASPHVVFFCVRRVTVATPFVASQVLGGTMQVSFALIPPKAPSAPVATAGDSHLKLNWTSNDTGDASYDIFVVTTGTAVDQNRAAATSIYGTSTDVTQDDDGNALVNGQQYDVYVRSKDNFGNDSALSAVGQGIPRQIDDFYNHYRDSGGGALGGGGCASGGEAGLLAAALLGMAFWRLRRRSSALARGGGLALLCACLLSTAARAQEWTGQNRPPRRWMFAFTIDRYDPQVDSEKGLVGTPYHDIFHGRAPLRYQIEAHWQPFHPFGSLLLGVTAGFWQNFGKGLYAQTFTDSNGTHNKGDPSNDTTLLDIVPLGLVATYRLDWFADHYRYLPIVPYAKAGLQAALWTSYSGTGNVSTSTAGGRGSGWTYGYTTALGVALDVGVIDVHLAQEAYRDAGIQRTSLFAEYAWTHLDDFGKSGALILSDHAWRFGLSVEF
jgi:hypothetical protein